MAKEDISQDFRLKELDKIENYFFEEIKQIPLISKKHKKIWKTLNYTKHLLILVSTVTGCVSISAFASLVSIPAGIASSATTIKVFVITAGIKKYELIIKKRNRSRVK